MKLRVDFLEENERRHLGPVSPKFLTFALSFTIGGLAVLGLIVLIWNQHSLHSRLKLAQQRWDQLAGDRLAQEALRAWKSQADRLQAEVDGWTQSRLACHDLGIRIARLADADWQALRLSYRDTLSVRTKLGGNDNNPALSRRFALTLTGRIRSEQANLRSAKLAEDLGAPLDGRTLFANPPVSQLSQQNDQYQAEIRGTGLERVVP